MLSHIINWNLSSDEPNIAYKANTLDLPFYLIAIKSIAAILTVRIKFNDNLNDAH